MPEYADIYVLSRMRTREEINRFLNAFVPSREETADGYEIPQYSNTPHTVFRHAEELIDYCCEHRDEVHTVYWRAQKVRRPEYAMVFFLADEHLIFGLSTNAADAEFMHRLGIQMKQFFETAKSLLLYEQCPPESAAAFEREIERVEIWARATSDAP